MGSAMDSGYVEVVEVVHRNGSKEKIDFSPPPCEAADCAPKMWGHKCIRHKGHPRRTTKHICRCGHAWMEPIEPDTSKVRTVGGELSL
jgi:hypothetical protein